jgi:hypothetical protein
MGRSFKKNRKWNGGNPEKHISLFTILTGQEDDSNDENHKSLLTMLTEQADSTKKPEESISNSASVLYTKEYIAKKIDNKHTSDITYTIDNTTMNVTRDGTGPYKVVFLSIV